MNVLITNDDGIDHVGLRTLVKEFAKVADVYVVAPHDECSSNSHHLSIRGKIRFEEREVPYAKKAFALWGTPADCVLFGIEVLLKDKIDLVVSGINNGANVSTDIIYSGTIGAARQAFIDGVPSLALSLDYAKEMDYEVCSRYGVKIALKYFESENKKDYFLNVNVPNLPEEKIKGIRVCHRSGKITYNDHYAVVNENGRNYITISHSSLTYDPVGDMDVDYTALKEGYITLSPLKNDHIDLDHISDVEELL